MEEEKIKKAAELIDRCKYVVALTGAGMSTESGIPDFRSPGGIWSKFDPEEFGSISSFLRDPAKFYQIAEQFKPVFSAQPNEGHKALAKLEQMDKLKSVITQNIDGLHQAAGCKNVVELHGNLRESKCMKCRKVYPIETLIEKAFQKNEIPPKCDECGGLLKPNVVMFGEQLPPAALDSAFNLTRECDLLIVAGSSLQVSPANLLPEEALHHDAKLIIINAEPTDMDRFAIVILRGKIGKILPQIVEEISGL